MAILDKNAAILANYVNSVGSQKIAAIDLGVTDSTISRILTGQRGVSKGLIAKIAAISGGNDGNSGNYGNFGNSGNSGNFEESEVAIEFSEPTHRDTQHTNEQSNSGQTTNEIPRSADDLEAAVMRSHPSETWELGDIEVLDPVADITLEISSEWRENFWLPMHDFLATFADDDELGDVVRKKAKSELGTNACASTHRACKRLGIDDLAKNGHWAADLAVIGMYLYSVKESVKSSKKKIERRELRQAAA